MKKRHSTVLQIARSQKKTNTFIEKTILALKTLYIHMKKRHSTVLQNAWNQKKTNTLIEKTILALKTL